MFALYTINFDFCSMICLWKLKVGILGGFCNQNRFSLHFVIVI